MAGIQYLASFLYLLFSNRSVAKVLHQMKGRRMGHMGQRTSPSTQDIKAVVLHLRDCLSLSFAFSMFPFA